MNDATSFFFLKERYICLQAVCSIAALPPELSCNTGHNPQTTVALFLRESSHVLDYGESCILGVVLMDGYEDV